MRTSKYSYNGKKLHELEKEEILDCVEVMWNEKNADIQALEAKCKVYESMLKSSHNIWRGFADNAALMIWVGFMSYLLGKH